MAVNVGQRNVPDTPQNRQLDACWKARELAIHTIKICNNKNIFLPEYQRSINDNALYPVTTKSFIYDNWACQTGKGPDKARERVKNMLWKFYKKYGNDGYVLQTDIKGYYPNMSHKEVKETFRKYLDEETHKWCAIFLTNNTRVILVTILEVRWFR